jgi:hypothetical protein
MDDFEFAALTRGEAEEVLLAWDATLGTFDLALNPLKTQIYDGPLSPEESWQGQIKHFALRDDTDAKHANDIRSLFSLAFQLAREFPTKSVLKYCVRRAGLPTGSESWRVFGDMILSSVIADPSALEAAHIAFDHAATTGLPIDNDALAETLNDMCCYHAPLEHGSEVAWSQYILRERGLPLTAKAASAVVQMRDNCSLLLLLEASAQGRVDGGSPDLSRVIGRAEDPDSGRSDDWLLAYEAGRHNWASDTGMQAVPAWAELRRLGVGFFLPSTRPSPLSPASRTPLHRPSRGEEPGIAASPMTPDGASTPEAPLPATSPSPANVKVPDGEPGAGSESALSALVVADAPSASSQDQHQVLDPDHGDDDPDADLAESEEQDLQEEDHEEEQDNAEYDEGEEEEEEGY